MSSSGKLAVYEARQQQQQEEVRQQLQQPGVPFAAPSYQETVKVAANAIANEIARSNKLPPAKNMIELVDPQTQGMCIAFAKAAVDAVSAYGRQKAAEAAAGEAGRSVEESTRFRCDVCDAMEVGREKDEVAGTMIVTFPCAAQVLVRNPFTEEMKITTRRVCKAEETRKGLEA